MRGWLWIVPHHRRRGYGLGRTPSLSFDWVLSGVCRVDNGLRSGLPRVPVDTTFDVSCGVVVRIGIGSKHLTRSLSNVVKVSPVTFQPIVLDGGNHVRSELLSDVVVEADGHG